MSLHDFDEICNDCEYAVWHNCTKCFGGPKFCHCVDHYEESVDHLRGSCEYRFSYGRKSNRYLRS